MILLRAVGLVSTPADLTAGQRADLQAWAGAFLRGGGSISLPEWTLLTAVEREALDLAGDAIRTEDVAHLALALRGPAAAADVIAPLDGGQAQAELLCAAGAEVAAAHLAGRRIG